jgi:hypothetical protein
MASRKFFTIALSFFALGLAGCGQSLEDLVRLKRQKDSTGIIPFEGQSSIKISPGNTVATSSDVSMSAHVTITDRPLTGSDVSASVSVSRQRSDGSP